MVINVERAECIKNWRLRWLALIFEFAHLEFQKNLWIDQKYQHEIGWFGEDVCQYFDDLSLDDNYLYQLNEQIISLEEYHAIKEFHFAFDHYLVTEKQMGIDLPDSARLRQNEWKNVVNIGFIAWNKLKQVIVNNEELKYMYELEKNYLNLI